MLLNNANVTNPVNGGGASAPFRLDRAQAATADQEYDYFVEQLAYHGGFADLFPMSVGAAGTITERRRAGRYQGPRWAITTVTP